MGKASNVAGASNSAASVVPPSEDLREAFRALTDRVEALREQLLNLAPEARGALRRAKRDAELALRPLEGDAQLWSAAFDKWLEEAGVKALWSPLDDLAYEVIPSLCGE